MPFREPVRLASEVLSFEKVIRFAPAIQPNPGPIARPGEPDSMARNQ
jgi:hypothetical protein